MEIEQSKSSSDSLGNMSDEIDRWEWELDEIRQTRDTIEPELKSLQEALSEVQKTDELVKLTIQVPKQIRSEFKIKAEREGTNMSTLILQYVKQYINK